MWPRLTPKSGLTSRITIWVLKFLTAPAPVLASTSPTLSLTLTTDAEEDDPLHLIVEIKGYRNEDAKAKKIAMETYWVPGVNNLRQYGRWAFAEFTDVYDMEAGFDSLISQTLAQPQSGEFQSYDGLSPKELLAAAPLEGIDLARPREFPRDVEL